MSNLNPGGSRQNFGRIFGSENIRRLIQSQKPDHAKDAENSIAGKPHSHSREVARRLRQQARKEAK